MKNACSTFNLKVPFNILTIEKKKEKTISPELCTNMEIGHNKTECSRTVKKDNLKLSIFNNIEDCKTPLCPSMVTAVEICCVEGEIQ